MSLPPSSAASSPPRASADPRAHGPSALDDHAAIGNCKTLALVSRLGSLDWLCLPHFSGESIFAALLDEERGGRFSLRPAGSVVETHQSYLEGSNVLRTVMRGEHGVLEVIDGMTVTQADGPAGAELEPAHEIFRSVRCLEGEIDLEAAYEPRPGYARRRPRLASRGRLGWQCTGDGTHLHLLSDLAFEPAGPCCLRACERLHAGDRRQVSLTSSENEIAVVLPIGQALEERIAQTNDWWRAWCAKCRYDGPWRDAVTRSALTLKLLTYCLSGAIVAAGTTSMPAGEDGRRNWDYRYCWLRDTSLALRAFLGLGHVDESVAFLAWLLHATRLTQPRLQVVYDVFGEASLPEKTVPGLRGWRGRGPVRVGNAACGQEQLDLYGELLATAREFVEQGGRLDRYEQRLVAGFARAAAGCWRRPDQGIWEIRLPPRHNTHSKLMCWVALDAALWLHERIGLPVDVALMTRERAAIRADIDAHAWDAAQDGYIGWYGGGEADASVMLMMRMGYLPPDDPRMLGTLALIDRQLGVDGGLLYRYPPGPASDGVPGGEGLFLLCSFWHVEAMVLQGRVAEAQRLFERLLSLRSPTGLYSEEFDLASRAGRGNFPQAFSHVGLIAAAQALESAQARPQPARARAESAP